MDDRSVRITIGGEEYELLLTTRATKEISKRYGGLEKFSDKIMTAEDFETGIDEVLWLVATLANQSVMIHNLKNPGQRRELLTADALELLTSPADLIEMRGAITAAMNAGMRRDIRSEGAGKNVEVG